MKKYFIFIFIIFSLFSCSSDKNNLNQNENLSEEINLEKQLKSFVKNLDWVVYPDNKKIIALWEVTHWNKELMELKQKVFFQLLEQQNFSVFAIEWDFWWAMKVNNYINSWIWDSKKVVSEMWFKIYKTKEMADLIESFKIYNQKQKEDSKKIRFYGFDMQRYDNTKDLLFGVLEKSGLFWLKKDYERVLMDFTDEKMFDLDSEKIVKTIDELKKLNSLLLEKESEIINKTSKKEFALAKYSSELLLQNTILRNASNDYWTLRDKFMFENLVWLTAFEKEFYNNEKIFITGHNWHISKTTNTVWTDKIMWEMLHEKFGDDYFAIVTEFKDSKFISSDYNTSEYKEFSVSSSWDKNFSILLWKYDISPLYFDLDSAKKSENKYIVKYLKEKQDMNSIWAVFSKDFEKQKFFHTQSISPSESFDSIIYFKELTPYSPID